MQLNAAPAHRERLQPPDDVRRRRVMYKDILVHIPTERPVRPVIDGSISLAAGLNAHLDAVAVGYVATSAAYILEGGAAVAAVFELERERAVERAEAALAVFKNEAMNAGISYTCHPGRCRGMRSACSARWRGCTISASCSSRTRRKPHSTTMCPARSCSRRAARCFSCPTLSMERSRRNGSASAGTAAASPRAPCATPHHSWPAPRKS